MMKTAVSRRTVLKLGGAGLVCVSPLCHSLGQGKTAVRADSLRHTKITGLLHNEDCTNFFAYQDFPAGKAGEVVDRYVDVLADAGVSVLMCNTNSRRTNYRSKVWEAYWDGYDPNGSDEQPFFAAVSPEQRKSYRKWVGNMLAVHNEGVDYPARVIERCRHRGIVPWISIRMNDVHNNDNLDHPFHSALWRKPEFFRQGHPGYFARALDYAHAEVRDHYLALIKETLERYDIAGLELDFMREPYLFSKGREQEGRQILTGWLREIRTLAKAAAKRRGHAVMLGVRVPSSPDTALGLGLDAPAWAREGLVDLVVVTPRWATLDFAMPLEKWRGLLGDRVTLAGGLEVLYRPDPASSPRVVTPDEARGAALAVLWSGADAVYLFNFFQTSHPGWPIPEYQRTLKSFSSLKELLKHSRRHAVTYRDVTFPDEDYHAPLPASGTSLSFSLPLGPAPVAGWRIETAIEFVASVAEDKPPRVSINSVAGKLLGCDTLKSGNRLAIHAFPLTVLSGKNRDVITVMAAATEPVTVRRVEVEIGDNTTK